MSWFMDIFVPAVLGGLVIICGITLIGMGIFIYGVLLGWWSV